MDAKSSARLVTTSLLAAAVALGGALAASCARASPVSDPSDGTTGNGGGTVDDGGGTVEDGGAPPGKIVAAGDGPHLLTGRATTIALGPGAAGPPAEVLAELGGRRLHLVLHGLAAEEPPGVLYHLYLGLAEGEEPREDDPRHVGSLNFFGVGAGGAGDFQSYDVTPHAGRLAAAAREGRALAVTFRSADPPAATPRIGRVELLLR